MSNFIKENWFKISIVVILLLVVLSAIYYFIFFIPTQKNLGIETNGIDSQAKCSTQAQKTLTTFSNQYTNDGWDSSTGEPASTRTNFTQSNHFNQKQNKCFVLIKYDFTYAGTLNAHFITNGETLFDAFQNDELASCVHSHRLSYDNFPEQYTDTCLIGQGNGLATLQNYNNFVNERMELGQ